MAQSIPELYGSLVFNDKIMREKLPKDMYKALKKTIENGTHLELDVANSVAVAMKEWALEHGATHYTHWFQPMTNFTAEKHDSFICKQSYKDIRNRRHSKRCGLSYKQRRPSRPHRQKRSRKDYSSQYDHRPAEAR